MKILLKSLVFLCGYFFCSGSSLAGEDMSNCMKCHEKDIEPLQKMAKQHKPFAQKLCTSCHNAKEHKKYVEEPEKLCYQCHDNYGKNAFVHGPVSTGSCTECHNPHASPNERLLVKPSTQVCGECHDVKPAAHTHKPVKENLCTKCHSPHGSQFKGLLVKDPTELCFQCHTKKEEQYVHGPYGSGACEACHAPHSSDIDHLLTNQVKDLCLDCHETFAEKLTLTTVHTVINKSGCSGCHDPHTTPHRFQLKKDPKDLCLSCHDKMQNLLTEATVKHKPVITDKGCQNCHDPHASNLNVLLLSQEREICLSCHNQTIKTEKTNKPLANIDSLLQESKEHHGPIRENLCSPCHNPHGSKYFRLLKKPYPAEFYAPFDKEIYGLCFDCHNPQVVSTQKTTELTNFRNGETNLHFLHVNQKKGRTCRSCHEVHASNWPKHIRTKVPYGKSNWELPLKFNKTETGGSCQPGCHKFYSYDRKNPVSRSK